MGKHGWLVGSVAGNGTPLVTVVGEAIGGGRGRGGQIFRFCLGDGRQEALGLDSGRC